MKRVVLFGPGQRLGNQLWNVAAVYAYCCERGYKFQDYSVADYRRHFIFPAGLSSYERTIGYGQKASRSISAVGRSMPVRAAEITARFGADLVTKLAIQASNLVPRLRRGPVLSAYRSAIILPPTFTAAEVVEAETTASHCIYLRDWLFWNPVGISRHRAAILSFLTPKSEPAARVAAYLGACRREHDMLVGVHMRQTDYRTYWHGRFYVGPPRFREILEEFLTIGPGKGKRVAFLVCSDEAVSSETFAGLDVVFGLGGEFEDLLALAGCDAIIGSNSTFSGFASYYGDIPMVIASRDEIEWEYYRDRTGYFENRSFLLKFLPGIESRDSVREAFWGE